MKDKIIKDLFLEEKSFIVTYNLNDKYFLYIEALDENGCMINHKYDERLITENACVELFERFNEHENDIVEWWYNSNFTTKTELNFVDLALKIAIKKHESEEV